MRSTSIPRASVVHLQRKGNWKGSRNQTTYWRMETGREGCVLYFRTDQCWGYILRYMVDTLRKAAITLSIGRMSCRPWNETVVHAIMQTIEPRLLTDQAARMISRLPWKPEKQPLDGSWQREKTHMTNMWMRHRLQYERQSLYLRI